ncbi:unnamed protein product [Lactuca saligna]|uniref:Gelsolin-like domain-containing protein n=1 Tax=Lactuca saligna TaxID=75948 RepID=A0AA35VL19_LACSI|nr:unnamed protein product [Lactuca saligna]
MDDVEAGELWGFFGGFSPIPKKTTTNDAQRKAIPVADDSLTKKLLDTHHCYLLDCGTEIYVWVGRSTNLEERKAANGAAEEHLRVHERPKSNIIRMIENFETVSFRSKFDSWPPLSDVVASEDGRGKVNTMFHLDQPMYLLGFLANQSRVYLINKEFNVAHFLESWGKVEEALEVTTDPDYRFELVIQLGKLDIAKVPLQVFVRRQIARLLDHCLQCARLVYNELVKITHSCLVHELQWFPVLKMHINDIAGSFLFEGLQPSQTMIGHLLEMEVTSVKTCSWYSPLTID